MDILAIFKTIVTVIYVPVCVVMVLIILLQAGRGGMGTALGGGASQGVFGGGGASDFMAKLTQGFAVTFMASAVFLAYATAHTGSDRLREKSDELDKTEIVDEGGEVDYERIGPNPLVLPFPGAPSEAVPTEPVSSPASAPTEAVAPTDAAPVDAAMPTGAAPTEGAAPTGAATPTDTVAPTEAPVPAAAADAPVPPAGEAP